MSKSIVVTGAAGGICSEICRSLAADGLKIVVADYAQEAAENSPRKFATTTATPSPCKSMSVTPQASMR